MKNTDFQFKNSRNGGDVTLVMSGYLDTLSATNLSKEVKEIIAEPFDSMEVEISGLDYISSSGLRCFVDAFKGCKSHGATFKITGIQPPVREIFDLTGFTKIFGLA